MKRVWIAVALLCGVVVLCTATTLYRHHHIEHMLDTLDRLERAYTQGNIPYARALSDEMIRHYERISRALLCFTAHSDMADSQETVQMLPALLQQNGSEELRMEIARLREDLAHLQEIDDPTLRNIL